MPNAAATGPEDERFVLSSLSPGPAQKRLALLVVLGLLAIFALITVGALSSLHLPRIDAFVPVYTTAMFVNDSITAILLFGQFSIVRSRGILVIASGYLFTALILIPWILAFPGVFGPTGLIGGMQSTSWLYFFWHAGFAGFVMGYALSKDADQSKRFWRRTLRTGVAIATGGARFTPLWSALALSHRGAGRLDLRCLSHRALAPEALHDRSVVDGRTVRFRDRAAVELLPGCESL